MKKILEYLKPGVIGIILMAATSIIVSFLTPLGVPNILNVSVGFTVNGVIGIVVAGFVLGFLITESRKRKLL